MKKILKYLSSPYPLFYQRWKVALISCGIVFFILLLFQPFGISAISHNKLGILLGYMVVTGLFLCIPVYLLLEDEKPKNDFDSTSQKKQ